MLNSTPIKATEYLLVLVDATEKDEVDDSKGRNKTVKILSKSS